MSRLTLPEMTEETQAEGFQYSYEVDEPAKAGEGKVIRSMFKNGCVQAARGSSECTQTLNCSALHY
jgi:hypothetical protein